MNELEYSKVAFEYRYSKISIIIRSLTLKECLASNREECQAANHLRDGSTRVQYSRENTIPSLLVVIRGNIQKNQIGSNVWHGSLWHDEEPNKPISTDSGAWLGATLRAYATAMFGWCSSLIIWYSFVALCCSTIANSNRFTATFRPTRFGGPAVIEPRYTVA